VSASASRTEAERAAHLAMDLDPLLVESNFAMALFTLFFVEDWPSAETHFKRALEINPRSSLVLSYFVIFLAANQRFREADVLAKRCLELDPLSAFVHAMIALAMSRYHSEEALQLAERALELHPDYSVALLAVGYIRCKLGQHATAIEVFEKL